MKYDDYNWAIKIARLEAEIAELKKLKTPDFIYDSNDWECTYCLEDRDLLIDHSEMPKYDVVCFQTLNCGPDVYMVIGDSSDNKWYHNEDEAKAYAVNLRKSNQEV
jgi:hypothetical protein